MRCQKQKFIITGKKTYLNCAYMSPMLKKVEKAGIKGLKLKRKPHRLLPEDFFTDVHSFVPDVVYFIWDRRDVVSITVEHYFYRCE